MTSRVSVPQFLCGMFADHLETRPRDPGALVFVGRDGAPLRRTNSRRRYWQPAVQRAGLPHTLRFHDLRHTCASLLIAQGAHPKEIQARLGHSSITTTLDRYGHLFPSLDERLRAALDETFRLVLGRASLWASEIRNPAKTSRRARKASQTASTGARLTVPEVRVFQTVNTIDG